jgi:ribosomal protein L13
VHVLLSVPNDASPKPKRVIGTATPEMLAKRAEAFEAVRKLNLYRDITDIITIHSFCLN